MMFNTGDLILDAVILSIVARTPEGTYGYKITQDVRSKMDVPESTFYPLLKQMQMDGYLEVYHKDLGGRSRRFYKITESGKERLEFCQQNWTNYLQNASSLLMSAPTQQGAPSMEMQPEAVQHAMVEAPVVEPVAQPVMVEAPAVEPVAQPVMAEVPVVEPAAQPVVAEAPVVEPAEPEFHIASSSEVMTDMEFSIGGDEVISDGNDLLSDEGDLFELDSTASNGAISIGEPEVVQPVMVEVPVAEPVAQPVMVEAPVVEPVAQPVMVEVPVAEPVAQPVVAEAPVVEPVAQPVVAEVPVVETPVQPVVAETPAVETPVAEVDDEADFLAEMALGQAEEAELVEEAEPEATETLEENMSELENLLSQLRTFETVMNAHKEQTETPASEASNTTNTINITDINAVADMLTPSSQSVPTETQPVNDVAPFSRYEEVRNPDTDDSVNSLVDLLKDDQPAKKTGFFKSKVAKASNSIKNMVSDTANAASSVEDVSTASAPQQSVKTPAPIKFVEVRNPDTDDSVNSLVDLLKDDQPKQKARFFRPKAAKETVAETIPSQPVVEKNVASEAKTFQNVKLTEVRSPETDDAVNSLVDLLKDDNSSSKPKLFKAWGNKSASNTQTASTPVAAAKAVEPAVQSAPVEMKEVRSPETDDAVNSLVDLLKEDTSSSKPKLFRSRAQKSAAPEKTPIPVVAKEVPVTPSQPVREVSDSSNSVDSLVDLLKENSTEQKPVSIFGKASAKSYTKVTAPNPVPATPVASSPVEPVASATVQDTEIPKPVVSEPKVFAPKVSSVTNKPTSAKSFEAKAASPNARPVETTATITKPLEAKAISTNPTVAKAAEAKSVETKAVVTPKAEAAKPDTAPAAQETAKEEIPMDSFKYRLMQANLLPDEK